MTVAGTRGGADFGTGIQSLLGYLHRRYRWGIHGARHRAGVTAVHVLIGAMVAWVVSVAGAGVAAASGTSVHIPSSARRRTARQCQLDQARTYRTRDAFDGLDFLRRQTFVDPENIFLIGQSNGDSVAMLAATEANQPAFRGAVALYPWCGATGSRGLQLAAPLLILGGARDYRVPPRDCQHLAATGAELRVKVYHNAAHSFDIPIPVQRYLGKRIGFNRSAAEDSREEIMRFFRRHVIDRRGTAALR